LSAAASTQYPRITGAASHAGPHLHNFYPVAAAAIACEGQGGVAVHRLTAMKVAAAPTAGTPMADWWIAAGLGGA
jgi:hypothetical protein